MASNFFDQFDAPAAQAAPSGGGGGDASNFFDQFDPTPDITAAKDPLSEIPTGEPLPKKYSQTIPALTDADKMAELVQKSNLARDLITAPLSEDWRDEPTRMVDDSKAAAIRSNQAIENLLSLHGYQSPDWQNDFLPGQVPNATRLKAGIVVGQPQLGRETTRDFPDFGPLVPPEAVAIAKRLGPVPIDAGKALLEKIAPKLTPAIEGIDKGSDQLISGLTTPDNLAIMGGIALMPEAAGAAGMFLRRALDLGFSAQAAQAMWEEFKKAKEFGPNTKEFWQHGTMALGSGAMMTLAGLHGVKGLGGEAMGALREKLGGGEAASGIWPDPTKELWRTTPPETTQDLGDLRSGINQQEIEQIKAKLESEGLPTGPPATMRFPGKIIGRAELSPEENAIRQNLEAKKASAAIGPDQSLVEAIVEAYGSGDKTRQRELEQEVTAKLGGEPPKRISPPLSQNEVNELGKLGLSEDEINAATVDENRAKLGGVEPSKPAPFVPSTEWQEVPPGTVLPNGGEYRMDQATGKNFARWPKENLPKTATGLQQNVTKVTPKTVTPGATNPPDLKQNASPQATPSSSATSAAVAGPALVDNSGKVIAQGKIGETHRDLLQKAIGTPNEDAVLEAFQNDKNHVFLDSNGVVLDRQKAGKIAHAAGQQAEDIPLQSENLRGTPSAPAPHGIRQEAHDVRKPGLVQPGVGGTRASVRAQGMADLHSGKYDVEEILSRAHEGVSGREMAVLDARHSELEAVTDAADEVARLQPTPANKAAAKAAYDAEVEFANKVKPAQTEWHLAGLAQQRDANIASGTTRGMARAVRKTLGRDPTPAEMTRIEKVVERVRKGNKEASEALSRGAEEVERNVQPKNKPRLTREQLKQRIENRYYEIAKKSGC